MSTTADVPPGVGESPRSQRTATEWFDAYGESHQNPVNKAIHWVCIPLIYLSTVGLLQSIPHPFSTPGLSWAVVALVVVLAFYARLSRTIMVGMGALTVLCIGINTGIELAGLPLHWVSIGVFGLAWVAQFIGHKIEGKKPSFLDELPFLLVGPAWLLQFVYGRVGIPVESPRPA